MDVEERIRAIEAFMVTANDKLTAHTQQLQMLALDMGHLRTDMRHALTQVDDAQDKAADVQVFRTATQDAIHRLSGESVDLRRDLTDHLADFQVLNAKVDDLDSKAPIAHGIFYGADGGLMSQDHFGFKKVDRVEPGYYFVHFDPPITDEKLFSVTLVTSGGNSLSYAFMHESKWSPVGNEMLLSVRTYVARGDSVLPIALDAYQVIVQVWQ